MNRHSYRVWDPLEKVYIFPYAINFEESTMLVQISDEHRDWILLTSPPEQCLGIVDKKKRPVYENDLILYNGYSEPLQIMWDEIDCAYFICIPGDECKTPIEFVYTMHFSWDTTVIGNINEGRIDGKS
jgi:hypothetical protein